MELKSPTLTFLPQWGQVLIAPLWNWNKSVTGKDSHGDKSSNRTFMELKWRRESRAAGRSRVLIAPLWNWNFIYFLGINAAHIVLIAPLWNWNLDSAAYTRLRENVLIAPLWNWNADYYRIWCNFYKVLIAPLWNWNVSDWQPSQPDVRVLIAPLWNWNVVRQRYATAEYSSNRTFMELKFRLHDDVGNVPLVLIAPLWNWNRLKESNL